MAKIANAKYCENVDLFLMEANSNMFVDTEGVKWWSCNLPYLTGVCGGSCH